ncbi:hypothetical protein ElyMa_002216100 [Elysia marginata]|uniref:GPI ethanolamine phosphate transferase 1 n=1 Tax=Elysia marginata TaxID=1093978 RepID=A0AAV4FV22_9GAST|nr:hypothetical protein ElyMa_002216100 [Elysia marginata]
MPRHFPPLPTGSFLDSYRSMGQDRPLMFINSLILVTALDIYHSFGHLSPLRTFINASDIYHPFGQDRLPLFTTASDVAMPRHLPSLRTGAYLDTYHGFGQDHASTFRTASTLTTASDTYLFLTAPDICHRFGSFLDSYRSIGQDRPLIFTTALDTCHRFGHLSPLRTYINASDIHHRFGQDRLSIFTTASDMTMPRHLPSLRTGAYLDTYHGFGQDSASTFRTASTLTTA